MIARIGLWFQHQWYRIVGQKVVCTRTWMFFDLLLDSWYGDILGVVVGSCVSAKGIVWFSSTFLSDVR